MKIILVLSSACFSHIFLLGIICASPCQPNFAWCWNDGI